MPRYIALAAITLDGKIAAHSTQFSNWTSKEDKQFLHTMLDDSDVIVVGNTTYETAKKPLAKRNCIVLTKKITGIKQEKDNLVFCNLSAGKLKAFIKDQGYQTVAILGGSQIYTYCLNNGMLDDLYLTIEPLAFGSGIDLFSAEGFKKQKFILVSIKKLNRTGSVLLQYKTE